MALSYSSFVVLLTNNPSLSVAQASSFRCLDVYMPTYATPTFITKVFHFATYTQLIVKVKATAYIALAYSY